MDEAASYTDWHAAAQEHDVLTGMDAWRADDASELYHPRLMRDDLAGLSSLRRADDAIAVSRLLQESLTRHLGDLQQMGLYTAAFGGTKHLVERYVQEVCETLDWLADHPSPGVPHHQRVEGFEVAFRNHGRTCLMLSGGGTLGWIHLGVVKALFEEELLPSVITGASMGAMIAAGICARTDAEITELFEDLSVVETRGLSPVTPGQLMEQGAMLDPEVMRKAILHNCGDDTFAQSMARTGRRLSISVSPTRQGQRSRLLNHLTAPDVYIAEAALASSAIPGVFPPARLMARSVAGERVPYLGSERWIDGSFHSDLPKWRVSRLFNVNHFIVSQTNPHVMPFLSDPRRRGLWRSAVGLTGRAALKQGRVVASAAAHLTADTPLRAATSIARALVDQDYLGDVDIHPQFRPGLIRKAFTNAGLSELEGYVRMGEQAAWPHLTQVRIQTRIGVALERCLARAQTNRGTKATRIRAVPITDSGSSNRS